MTTGRPATDGAVVVTPWYPTPARPYAGSFVREHVLALAEHEPVAVVHVENVAPDDRSGPSRAVRDGVTVVHVPVPTGALTARAQMARNQLAALRAADLPELAAPRRVHAHVTMPTAWAVGEVVPASTRLLVTEHSSTVGKLLRDAETRAMYAQTLARADAVTVVSEFLARGVRAVAPDHAHRVVTVPNAVDLARLPLVARPEPGLRRWVYVGNLLASKGVFDLVDAFAERAFREGGRDCSLTLVGDGADREPLQAHVVDVGLADQVHLLGAVAPSEVPGLLAQADVLVHLSRYETFGLSVLEALAAGLCVVSTRSGGPVETLAPAVRLGRAELVDGPGAAEVVDAVERLSERLEPGDAARAREQIGSRYSPEVVTTTIRHLLHGVSPVELVNERSVVRVLAVSLHGGARRRVTASLTAVVEEGGTAVVITDDVGHFRTLGPAVEVLDARTLGTGLRSRRVPTSVRTLRIRAHGLVHRTASLAARRAPGTLARDAGRLADRSLRRRRALAEQRSRPELWVLERLQPLLLVRAARRRGLLPPDLDVVLTPLGNPRLWRLALRGGQVPAVRRSLTRDDVVDDHPRSRPRARKGP